MLRYFFFIIVVFCSISVNAQPTVWKLLTPGIEYTSIDTNHLAGKLHAFRIDLNYFSMGLLFAQDSQEVMASVKHLADEHNAMIAINGGFFSPDHIPLGLRIQNGKIRTPLKTSTAWWGVFYVENNRPYVTTPKNFQYNQNITFAVQAGPRLLVDGHVPTLKENFDERSALCITRGGQVIIAATDNARLSTGELANLLKNPSKQGGLECQDALNLDGGTSTQLYANIGRFYLYVPSFMPIADAIVVTPKLSG